MNPPPQLEKTWQLALSEEWAKPYMESLREFIAKERASNIPIYPNKEDIFNAFNCTPFPSVNVAIIGQDPYHGPGQAHGLCFSVQKGIPQPPSLKNIFKELREDLGISSPSHGCLLSWAQQGILLLNTILTVRENSPRSHYGKGWEEFTDAVVSALCKREDPIIFILWGKAALEKFQSIRGNAKHHQVLTASHPSPYSAYSGFFGCRHFSKINELLTTQGKRPINWEIE